MKTKNIYGISVLSNFYNKYNVNKEELNKSDHFNFRYLCFKYMDFMRHIELPKIKKNLYYEAVLIEYRIFPHLEFLIRNAILKLGEKWSHTIVCGTNNYDYMIDMCQKISPNINIIKTEHSNLSPSQYSEMLTTLEFWNLFEGKKILIYQEDSIIFKNNVEGFLFFDFIGAPFPKAQNDTPNNVGNGGLSIRTTEIMKKVIQTQDIKTMNFNSSTLEYMKIAGLTFPPEDVYFSKCMQELKIGKVADWNTSHMFSSESVLNINSFAGHKFWISNIKWKKTMNHIFKYDTYNYNNDIKKYLLYKNLPLEFDKTPNIKNAFDVDLHFCNVVNNLNARDDTEILNYIKNVSLDGFIYHPKQIKNIYPNVNIYTFMDSIFIEYNLVIYKAAEFVDKYLYKKTFNEITKKMIKNVHDNLDTSLNLLLLVFIGNETIGKTLIEKIIAYKKIEVFNIAFCFNSVEVSKSLKDFIKVNFKNFSIYISNEMGTDITPTMLMYQHISSKYHFKHIIKLHTKSIQHQFNDLTNDILSVPLNKLLEHKKEDCNCIGNTKYYIELKNDPWVKHLLINNSSQVNITKKFVGGTIFYAESNVFDSVLKFIKDNSFRSYLLNNLYENNTINKDFSPIHFLERLFGIINV